MSGRGEEIDVVGWWIGDCMWEEMVEGANDGARKYRCTVWMMARKEKREGQSPETRDG